MAHSAVSGSVMSEGPGRPTTAMKRWNGLMSGVYITFQIRPTTIGGSTIGIRKTVRTPSRSACAHVEQQGHAEPRPAAAASRVAPTA